MRRPKVTVVWKPLERSQVIWNRILIVGLWFCVPAAAYGGVQRFGVTWPAIEWVLAVTLCTVLFTALILRVERAQREQAGEKK